MVQINIWFVPRSRSTALVRCLSNISDSQVFFENFLWAFYLGDEDSMFTKHRDQMAPKAHEHVVPGFNTNSAIKQFQDSSAKVKISKDFIFALNGRYEEVIEKDSVNVFLVRDPANVFTSFLPTSNKYFHAVAKGTHKDLTVYYGAVLQGVEKVALMCSVPPMIVDGSQLSTTSGATKVVSTICEKAGIEFSESFLTWEAGDGLPSSWVAPKPARSVNELLGFFARANKSTGFEDSKERVVDLEEIGKEHPEIVEDIKACKPYYEKVISLPYMFKL